MHISNLLYELRQQEMADLRFENFLASADHGRGLDRESSSTTICQHCDRATVVIEHEFTPQISFRHGDEQPEGEGTYYTCEWCGSVVDPANVHPATPRKPAGVQWGTPAECDRRMA